MSHEPIIFAFTNAPDEAVIAAYGDQANEYGDGYWGIPIPPGVDWESVDGWTDQHGIQWTWE